MAGRSAVIERTTAETWVRLELGLDGPAGGNLATSLPFLDHMLAQLQRHGQFFLEVKASGDLEVDVHHLIEDVGITLGMALDQALGDRHGIERFGEATVPLDESLVQTVIDFSGRSYLGFFPEALEIVGAPGAFNAYHLREFLRGMCQHARLTLHLRVLAGQEAHHVIEASFKSLARALRQATRITRSDLPSTKESI